MPRPNSRVPRAFSMDELADRWDVSTKTISRWIAAGKLRAHRIGRVVRISEEDALAFWATHRD